MTSEYGQENDTGWEFAYQSVEEFLEKHPERTTASHFGADFKPISGDWWEFPPGHHSKYVVSGDAFEGDDRQLRSFYIGRYREFMA